MRFIKTASFLLSIGLLAGCGSSSDSISGPEPRPEPSFKSNELPGLYQITTTLAGEYSIRFDGNNTGYIFNPDAFYNPLREDDNFGNAFTWSLDANGAIEITYAGNALQERLTLTNGQSSEGQLRFEADDNLDGVYEYFEDGASITKIELSSDFEPVINLEAGNYSLNINNETINYTLTNDVYSENIAYKLGARNGEYVLWTTLEDEADNPLANRLLITTKDPESGENLLEEYFTAPDIDNTQIEYAANIINDANLNHSIEYISKTATWEKQANPTAGLQGGYNLVTDAAYSLRFNDDNTGYAFFTDTLFDGSSSDFGEAFTWNEESDGYVHILYESGSKQQKLAITSQPSFQLGSLLFEDTGLDEDYESIENHVSLNKQAPDDFVEEFTSYTSVEAGTYTLTTAHGSIEYVLTNEQVSPDHQPYLKAGHRDGEFIIWFIYTNEMNQSNPEVDHSHLVGRLLIWRYYSYLDTGSNPYEFISPINTEGGNTTVQFLTQYHGELIEQDDSSYILRQNTYIDNDATWVKNTVEEE